MIKKSKIAEIEKGVVRKTRPPEFEGKLRYKKISGGVHRHSDGQIVKKGGILYAKPGELSKILLAGYTCLDDEINEAAKGISLGLRDRGNGWFDVINKKTGEVLNDTALRGKDARQFITGEPEEEDLVTPDEVNEDLADEDLDEDLDEE